MQPQVRTAIDTVWQFCQDHREDAWNVPREGGMFLYATAIAMRASRILEVGCSYGFSTLHLAAAAAENGGSLVTIDSDQRKVQVAGKHIESAGLGNIVTVRHGLAQDVIGELDGPFDLVFIDAVKKDTLEYFRKVEGKLADRAVVITDNLTTHDESAFGEFLPIIRNRDDYVSMVVPVGNGFELSARVPGPGAPA